MNAVLAVRAVSLKLLAVLAVLGLCACSSSSDSTSTPGSAPSANATPQKLSRNGRWFTDDAGRVVVIHGTNMINKLPPYSPDVLGFDEEDLRFLAENGFNGIRIGLTWAGVEPEPGVYDDAYIDKLVALAAAAARHGMLPVLDFHQDGYSEKYGGNGAPDWANIDFGVPGSPLPPPANVLPGAAIANESFWLNAAAPDGIGLQDHYAAAWRHVAQRFSNDPHTVFELYNEPSPGFVDVAVCALPIGCPQFDILKLAPFYAKVLQAIREVDATRLVFVEPTALFGLGARTWLPATDDPQIGFAFHNYCALDLTGLPLPAEGCSPIVALTLANAQAQFDATGEPLLMNEFGAFNTDEVVADLLDRSDQMMLSWMHWAYWAQDFGEEATYGLINDLGAPPTDDNIKQGLLRALSRPKPRLIAGTPQRWSWDEATSTFEARYLTARADGSGSFADGSVSAFFINPRFFPDGYRVEVIGGRVTSAANASLLTIASLPGAESVTVTVFAATAD